MKGRRQRVVDLLRHESNLMHPANDNVAKPEPKRQVLFHPRDTTGLSGAVSGSRANAKPETLNRIYLGNVSTSSLSDALAFWRIGVPSPTRRVSKSIANNPRTLSRSRGRSSMTFSGKSLHLPGGSPTAASPTITILRSGQCNTTSPGDLPGEPTTTKGPIFSPT